MPIRNVVVAAGVALLAVSCSCGRDADAPQAFDRAGVSRPNEAPATRAARLVAQAPVPARPDATRDAALHGATDIVQRYLAAAGAADWPRADAFWGYRRAPAAGEEGGLRALMPPRAMRIENQAPRVLDNEPVPAYVEIPVRLRIDGRDGLQHRYAGWYRLRQNPVEQRWELIATSMAAQVR